MRRTVGLHPDYLKVWLPGTLVVGLGIGLTFPVLSAAAVSSLHHERFAVGSAVNQTARQVGGAIGVALLVVILGTPTSAGAALSNFHHLWLYAAPMAVLSGFTSTLLRSDRGRLASDPVPVTVRESADRVGHSREAGEVSVILEDRNWGEQRAKTVTWHDPMITAEAAATLSGLQFLRAIRDGSLLPLPSQCSWGSRCERSNLAV